MRQAIALWVCVAAVAFPSAQLSEPGFEVASVRENTSGVDRYSFSAGLAKNGLGQDVAGVGMAVITNAPLREIIARAYGIEVGMERFTLFGEQPILERRFDIAAQPPSTASSAEPPGARVAMLKSLLADRFKLRVRTESRSMPVYALVLARKDRLGPNLRRAAFDCVEIQRRSPTEARELRDANGVELCNITTMRFVSTIDVFMRSIRHSFQLPLIDDTGLEGSFDWSLIRSDGATIADAIEEQLGLKIERRSGQRDVLVIDSVEMPTPN
jgi:uncharacterized protein (TIGR03435 family)